MDNLADVSDKKVNRMRAAVRKNLFLMSLLLETFVGGEECLVNIR
jgi:hypothetical protein